MFVFFAVSITMASNAVKPSLSAEFVSIEIWPATGALSLSIAKSDSTWDPVVDGLNITIRWCGPPAAGGVKNSPGLMGVGGMICVVGKEFTSAMDVKFQGPSYRPPWEFWPAGMRRGEVGNWDYEASRLGESLGISADHKDWALDDIERRLKGPMEPYWGCWCCCWPVGAKVLANKSSSHTGCWAGTSSTKGELWQLFKIECMESSSKGKVRCLVEKFWWKITRNEAISSLVTGSACCLMSNSSIPHNTNVVMLAWLCSAVPMEWALLACPCINHLQTVLGHILPVRIQSL